MPSRGFPRSIILAIVVSTVALPVTAMLAWPGPPVASAAEPRPAADRAVLGSAIADATACRVGLEAVRLVGGQALHGVALTPSGGWAVGYASDVHEDDLYARRRPTVLLGAAGTWTRVPVRGSGREDGLMAVAARGDDRAWAVGFTTIQGAVMPLAIKWDGRRWRVARPRPVGQLDSVLTDVTIAEDGSPWAVGYRMAGDGRRRPIAVRRQDGRWRYLDPAAGRDTSVSLTAVAPDGAGGLWGVGHAGRGDAIGPAIYRRARGRWERLSLPPVAGEGVLTGIATVDARDAWAVGYQQDAGLTRPLVLRWDGRRWARIGEPGFRSSEVVLTAVAASTSGDIVVVGTRKVDGASIHEAVGARWDGRNWSALAGVGDSELFDVVADREGQGLAVGRAGRDAVIARSCPHDSWASVRIHEPAGAAQSAAGTAGGMGPFTAIEATGAEPRADGLEDDPETVPHAAGPGRVPGPGRRLRSLRPLPHAKALARLSARDVASQRGLPGRTSTYGAIAADFDGDGRDDLYIGRHGRQARLLLNRDGTFAEHGPMAFPLVDRHGCAASDVDASGLPDLYCAVGGHRGTGLKANELWIDPGGPAPVEVASAAGVSDPTGRGRHSAFLRSGRDGTVDLVVTNSPTRVDGWPSPSRLYRTAAGGDFAVRGPTGFATGLGGLALQAADVDGDDRDDLLLVTGGLQAPRAAGTRLYRNTPRGLADLTRRVGIRSFGEVDAQLVDISGDGHLDLVQLGVDRLRVSLWRDGRFRMSYERRLRDGRAIASGDADGDGRPDLYLVRASSRGNPPDILLLDRGRGRRYASMRIPQVRGGDGQDAVAIDHDGNGLTDFLVLNGRTRAGPLQLVAFFPR